MEGWIKLHRKFIKWEWFNDLNTSHIFLYLLLSANSKDGRWKGIEVKRGQLIAGLSTISKHTGLTIRQARTSLDHLKTTHEIAIKSTNKYSIITICKYDSYQDKDNIDRQAKRQAGSLLSDKQTTSKRQQTRSKEGKEGEEEKNSLFLEGGFQKTLLKDENGLQEEFLNSYSWKQYLLSNYKEVGSESDLNGIISKFATALKEADQYPVQIKEAKNRFVGFLKKHLSEKVEQVNEHVYPGEF